MTGTEIQSAAEVYLDEMIDTDQALAGINAGLAALGDSALNYDTQTITTASANTVNDLTSGVTNVVEVRKADGSEYRRWKVRGQSILLADAATYTVYFRKLPSRMTALTETPECHPAFHECLVTYLIGWFKRRDDEDSADGNFYMQKFYSDAGRIYESMVHKPLPKQMAAPEEAQAK